jgi:broad specificity phosphatase PhoE
MSVVLVFESHATSVDNETALASGWFDAGLSRKGEEQARALGARRRHDDFASVFCSDLTRAVRTAQIAFGDRGIPIVQDPRLRECNYGALTRSAAGEVEARRLRYVEEPFPAGESYQQVAARVSAWLEETAPRFDDGMVIAIGHRATFYALEHLLNNRPLREVISAPWRWQPGWTYHVALSR